MTPVLFHGTTRARARAIMANGFRRNPHGDRSYTGSAVNLSECVSVAYTYGDFDAGGVVLAVGLNHTGRYAAAEGVQTSGNAGFDAWFNSNPDQHGLVLYGGNVWLLWDTAQIQSVKPLSRLEAVTQLIAEFNSDGPECAYNGSVRDWAEAFRGEPGHDPAMRAFLLKHHLL